MIPPRQAAHQLLYLLTRAVEPQLRHAILDYVKAHLDGTGELVAIDEEEELERHGLTTEKESR